MGKERFQAPITVHLFFLQEKEILLLRRYKTGYEDGNYSVVAGHLDGRETVVQAAIREAKEEAGVDLVEKEIEPVGVMHRNTDGDERIDFFVVAKSWTGEIRNMEPDKCDDLRFFPVDKLPVNTIPYIRLAIENYQQQKWFDIYGW